MSTPLCVRPQPGTAWNNLRVLTPLFAASVLAVNVAVIVGAAPRLASPEPVGVALLFGLAFSQVSLCATWLALAKPGSSGLALALLLATLAFWTNALDERFRIDPEIRRHLALLAGLVFAGQSCLCLGGQHLVLRERVNRRSAQRFETGFASQYSLRSLFLWTTLAAMAALAARSAASEPMRWLTTFSNIAPQAAIALLASWAALAPGSVVSRVIAVAVVSPVLGAAPAWGSSVGEGLHPALVGGFHALLLLVCLGVFRIGGYRIVRQ